MEIKYDDCRSIDASDLVELLERYARSVLARMQEIDEDSADCWTACGITFEELSPDFTWGSIRDLDSKDYDIIVEVPETK